MSRPRAFLLGEPPRDYHNYIYVNEKPYEAVIIGRVSPATLLHLPDDTVCDALLDGIPVYLWPQCVDTYRHGKALCRALNASQAYLLTLGVKPMGGLVTADLARLLVQTDQQPWSGSRLTPLARDILEGRG